MGKIYYCRILWQISINNVFYCNSSFFINPWFFNVYTTFRSKKKYGNLNILIRKKIYYSFLSAIILIGIGVYYQVLKEDKEIAYILYIVSFLYPFYNLQTIWESWVTAIGEYKKLSILQINYALIGLISVVISLIFIKNIYLIVLITFSSVAISNVFIIKFFQGKITNDVVDYELINYGYKLSFAMIIPTIMSFDKLIISEHLTIKDVAIYSVAMLFSSYIKIIYKIIGKLITPSISSANSIKEAWVYLKPKLLKISIFFLIIGLVGFVTIEYVIYFLYTNKYSQSAMYAKWLWLFVALTVPTTYLADVLRAQKRLKFEYISLFLTSMIKLLVFIILLPRFNLWGIVYAVGITNLFTIIFYAFYFNYEYKKESLAPI